MQKYLIERDFPGAGKLSVDELKAISEKSNGVLKEMGTGIQWVQSYIAGDKIYCVYNSESVELIKEHARCAGFPVNLVTPINTIIDPTTPGK